MTRKLQEKYTLLSDTQIKCYSYVILFYDNDLDGIVFVESLGKHLKVIQTDNY